MKIIKTPSPNFSSRPDNAKIDTIVLHYTGMKSTKAALDRMCNPDFEVSAHYCIAEDGRIYQLVEDDSKAWHAGKSFWRGRENINNYSIGIEIANPGHEWGYKPFEEEQIDSVIELCKELIENYDIKPGNIVAHSDIAPERKEDPGELFPWQLLAEEGVGIWHDITAADYNYDKPYDFAKEKNFSDVHKKLSEIGYKCGSAKEWDEKNEKAVTAFYRRFIPERIKLSKNHRYPENIKWDQISDTIADSIINCIKELES